MFSDALLEVKDSLDKDLQFFCTGGEENVDGVKNLESLLLHSSTSKPPQPKEYGLSGEKVDLPEYHLIFAVSFSCYAN